MNMDSEQPEVVHIEDISLHGQPSITLLQLLSNTLVLHHTLPLIPISSLLALGASSTSFKNLIYSTPNVFRHLDLTPVNSARSEVGAIDHGGEVWRNQQLDENVTEDDFYGGPLRGIFNGLRRRNILKDVQTLILDGLAVPSDLVAEIILDPSFNVRLLSIREVQHLNEAKLRQALQYAVRSSRPEGTPKLQGLYVFGPKDPPSLTRYRSQSSQAAEKAQIGSQWNQKSGDALWEQLKEVDRWYQKNGRIITRPVSDAWAGTLQACNGVISFDAVLCRGPRHQPSVNSGEEYLQPTVATYALEGCAGCGTSPEGFSMLRTSPWEQFPLLAPLSLHSSTIKAAKTPSRSANGAEKKLLARCFHCIRNRYCESCQKWWCENCYSIPPTGIGLVEAELSDLSNKSYKIGVTRSCFECGLNCASCIERTQLMCRICGGGYCTIHNEGSTLTTAVRLYGSFHKASGQTHPEMTANVLQGVPKAVVAPEKCTKS